MSSRIRELAIPARGLSRSGATVGGILPPSQPGAPSSRSNSIRLLNVRVSEEMGKRQWARGKRQEFAPVVAEDLCVLSWDCAWFRS